ncbi:MAG: DUF459 domain-containing protein [Deltaproteobacteria bacterium]|nr:DUF459 domain-containing protein [Deltaproteobacteria bacterium]
MRFKRKGLTPWKIVRVYALAFLLVLVHEADRVASWLEDLGRAGDSYPFLATLNLAADLQALARASGLTRLKDFEARVLEAMTPRGAVGAKRAPAARAPEGPAPALTTAPKGEIPSVAVSLSPPPETPGDGAGPIPPPDAPAAPDGTPPPAGAEDPEIAIFNIQDQPPAFANVLIIGDSFMVEGFGPVLERELKVDESLAVKRIFRSATGLSRPDYFNWPIYFGDQVESEKPDLIVISLGANDTQDIVTTDRKRHNVATDGWNEEYALRVQELLDIASNHGATVFWVGLPIMGKPTYNVNIQNLNEVVAKTCAENLHCRFFDSSDALTDENGDFTAYLTMPDGTHERIRAKDSIHLTELGGKILVQSFLETARDWGLVAQTPLLEAPRFKSPPTPATLSEVAVAPSLPPVAVAATEGTLPATAPQEPPFTLSLDPPAPYPQNGPASPATLVEVNLPSKARSKQTSYLIYLPGSEIPRPTVFLLHGVQEDQNVWKDRLGRSLLDLAQALNVNLVMPDGEPFGWYLDSPFKKNSRQELYLTQELLPDLLRRFQIDPARVGIMGVSMGGHGALTLALKNPGLFRAVGSIGGVTDLELHREGSALDGGLRLEEVLGPAEAQNGRHWRQNGAYYLTRLNPEALRESSVFLTVGKSDELALGENRQYHRLLADLGLEHQYEEARGNHSWDLWRDAAPRRLADLAAAL